MAQLSRRKLLSGQWHHHSGVIRPPWSREEPLFLAGCTQCQACINACETGVLQSGSGGFPEIDFQRAECTFCRQCAQACEAPLFYSQSHQPWQQVALFSRDCLALHTTECRSCQDSCETQAIGFRPRLRGPAQPVLNAAQCNGCGACVAPCPAGAIAIIRREKNE